MAGPSLIQEKPLSFIDQMNRAVRENPWRGYLPGILVLAIVLRAALLISVLHASGTRAVFDPDTPSYVATIHSLMHGSFQTDNQPELNRTPGYPIFLLLTGMASNRPLLSVTAQILLAALCVYLVYEIGTYLFRDGRIALLCALLYAIEPGSITYSILLYPEVLFTTGILVFLLYIVKYLQDPSWGSLLVAAVALSASVYVKPVAYYLPVFCAVGVTSIAARGRVPVRLISGAVFAIACAALIVPWQVRNYEETDYSGMSSLSDWQIYSYNAINVLSERDHVSMRTEWDKSDAALRPRLAGLSEAQRCAIYKHEAERIIKENPVLFLKVQLRGVAAVLFDPSGTENLKHLGLYPFDGYLGLMQMDHGIVETFWWVIRRRPLIALVDGALGAILAIYYLLALLGIPMVAKRKNLLVTLTLLFIYFVFLAGGPAGRGRYRYPVTPIVALFAGAGLARLIPRKRAAVTSEHR